MSPRLKRLHVKPGDLRGRWRVHAIAPNQGAHVRSLCGAPELAGEVFRTARSVEFVTCPECLTHAGGPA